MQKRRIHAQGLRDVHPIGSSISRSGRREVVLNFENTSGITPVEGRETGARLTGPEIARVLGSVPAIFFDGQPEMWAAYKKTLEFLKSW